ncbi:SLATT domain-containing protein [Alysiella filiformis]|uniref:SLATT domain-containing protein n=1 Tax=Alysiella filiformis TaxID=194196 RepID=UPI001FD4A89E|nr:SLATT domain-containing protein [Alysiella filiformis]
MEEQDFPALYRDADALSLKSQKHFFRALIIHLCVLVIGAILSIFSSSYWWTTIAQCIALLCALACSIYLFIYLRNDQTVIGMQEELLRNQ